MARKLTGVVTSDVQDKTITVTVSRSVTHPIYGKRYTVSKKFAVHDFGVKNLGVFLEPSNGCHKREQVKMVVPVSQDESLSSLSQS